MYILKKTEPILLKGTDRTMDNLDLQHGCVTARFQSLY